MVTFMQIDNVYTMLDGVFRSVFEEPVVLSPELSAKDVDEWDSLTHLRLMLTVEKAFNVKFSASEIGNLKNVGELAQLIQTKSQ
jgi:acyl carrier protein